jgi:alpha/beta superfamily hydrolase
MRSPELDGFIAVAPPANMYDFSFLAPCPVSGMILQGGKDEIVTKDSVVKLATRLIAQRGLQIDHRLVPEADHYFTNEIPALTAHVHQYVTAGLNPLPKVVNG